MNDFHSGFAAIIGRPNVGKSTLMNLLTGAKISIVSSKPQTTRNKIRGILTRENYQIIFIDTPGMRAPSNKLGAFMLKSAETAMRDVDVLLWITALHQQRGVSIPGGDRVILEKLRRARADTPVFLILNKIDLVEKPEILRIIDAYRGLYDFAGIIPISALKAENTDDLLDAVKQKLPPGPLYFQGDMMTDQPERQIAAEIIREKALRFLREEVPHGVAVEIISMKKRAGQELVDLEATIYCEKSSHKGIIIGKNGEGLKKIGAAARLDTQRLLGSPVYLQLWVKVKKNWRDSDYDLKNFGYGPKQV
ncbi:MAG: GTPase Era [Clostridiales bacterium]|nr:GTPase Era [Clostridiales bacterium]